MNEPVVDERAQVGAAYAAEVKADEAAKAPPPPPAPNAQPGPTPEAHELGTKEIAALLWQLVDHGAKQFNPELAQKPEERELLATHTVPVLEKHLPKALQSIGPEWALLGVVALVYAPKLGLDLGSLVGAAAPSSAAPAAQTVEGEAREVAA